MGGWKGCMDKDGSGRVEKSEFLAACEELQYEHDANRLFALFDWDSSGFVSIEEIDAKAAEAMGRGFELAAPTKKQSEMTFEERQASQTSAQVYQLEGKANRAAINAQAAANIDADVGRKAKAEATAEQKPDAGDAPKPE